MKSEKSRVKIPIPDSVYLRLKQLYQHGDFTEIANAHGFKVWNIQNTWNERKGRKEFVNAIIKFYDKRQSFIEASVPVLNTEPAQ